MRISDWSSDVCSSDLLNMDVRHVAFSALRKFDGRTPRALTPGEVAQIAGRAGRHMNDGTFGTTAEIPGMYPMPVQDTEEPTFQPPPSFLWRKKRTSDIKGRSVSVRYDS